MKTSLIIEKWIKDPGINYDKDEAYLHITTHARVGYQKRLLHELVISKNLIKPYIQNEIINT